MADKRTQTKLISYLQDAQAMERSVLMMLNSMIFSTTDPLLVAELRRHREETQLHEERLTQRLQAVGAGASPTKQAVAVAPTLFKGMLDQVRGDKPNKNARDGFITEHMEIATYELLERIADHAGDAETASVARANRADEERMAAVIAANWDRVVAETLGNGALPARSRRSTANGRRSSGTRSRGSRRTGSTARATRTPRSTSRRTRTTVST